MTARILIIAGSDSGGGAGIQADIKTVTMLGGYAMTAITAVTAQNTVGVQAVSPMIPEVIAAQIDSVISDIGVDAIKIGMLPNAESVRIVGSMIVMFRKELRIGMTGKGIAAVPIVVDPVMVATSGDRLVDDDAVKTMFTHLFPFATVVTPNLEEFAALGGDKAFPAIKVPVLVKGGHGAGTTIIDRLIDLNGEIARWEDRRINSTSTHGTGCTLSTAIACGLGQGLSLPVAIERARRFVRAAIVAAPGFGQGHGPMGHQAVRDL